MKARVKSRQSLMGLGGWLFADLLLVLSVVWLGTQSYFDPSVLKLPNIVADEKPRVLDPHPNIVDIPFDAALVRSGETSAVEDLHQALMNQGMDKLEKSGRVAGIVMTFAGGDDCGQVRAAGSTSVVVNKYLLTWYPNFIVAQTVMKAYVDYSCSRANHLKLEIYSFAR